LNSGSFILKKRKPKPPQQYKSKTSYFYKFLIIVGIVLLIIYAVGYFFPTIGISDNVLGTILAFFIIFIGLGIIIYFLHCQFAKLARIVEEIENDEELKEIE